MPGEVEFDARFVTSDINNEDETRMDTDSFLILIRSSGQTSADFCVYDSVTKAANQDSEIEYFTEEGARLDIAMELKFEGISSV